MDNINRYEFCKGSTQEYLLNTETGDMWLIHRISSGVVVFKPIPIVDDL